MKRSMPLGSREVPLRRSAIAKASKKRKAQGSQRAAAERELGREALCGTCARCGRYGYVNGHERRSRSQGGRPEAPDCLLCTRCNSDCECFPLAFAWSGWKLSRKHPRDPSLSIGEARRPDGSIFTFGIPDECALCFGPLGETEFCPSCDQANGVQL